MKEFINYFCIDYSQATSLIFVAFLGGLTGCGSLPSAGPSISAIKQGADTPTHVGKYAFIPVDQKVVDLIRQREVSGGLSSLAAPARPTASSASKDINNLKGVNARRIAVGDVLAINIFTSGGGLFISSTDAAANGSTASNSSTSLPVQPVDDSGQITVPYIGRVKVIGRTPAEVEGEITEGLKAKAISPWTIVTIQDRMGSSLVTVTGDVRDPKRVDVPPSGLRLVDAVASAGGSTARDYETMVTVTRGNVNRSDLYGDVVRNPKKNVFLEPGDTIVLNARHWTFTTLGATAQKLITFPSSELTMSEALASADGLIDSRSNPEAVFVYRFESSSVMDSLNQKAGVVTAAGIPVIYQINMRSPDGLFLASQFTMRDKDILFVGNAGSVGVMKALGIFNAATAPFVQGASVATGIGTISALNGR